MLYRSILLFKFIGVSMYAGGLVAAFVSTVEADRYRAVHRVASPGLLSNAWVIRLTAQKRVDICHDMLERT